MAVDDSTNPSSTSEPTQPTTTSTPTVSAATKKKEEEAKAEREKKYPLPHKKGIVLAAEKKVTSKLLEKEKGSSEKLFMVNGYVSNSSLARDEELTKSGNFFCRNVISGVAGYNADANSLVSYARNAAQVSSNIPMLRDNKELTRLVPL